MNASIAENAKAVSPDILMVDNYDSFTWNVVQYFWELGASVDVYRNDEITVDDIARIRPKLICVSPGPCSPTEAGISIETIKRFAGDIPVFGICLGLQSIGAAYGGDVIRAPRLPQWYGCFCRSTFTLYGNALPFAGRRSKDAAPVF